MGLIVNAHPFQQAQSRCFGLILGNVLDLDRCQRDIFQDRKVRIQVELLKNDANLGPQVVDVDVFIQDILAIKKDLTFLIFFQSVDAADKGGFT